MLGELGNISSSLFILILTLDWIHLGSILKLLPSLLILYIDSALLLYISSQEEKQQKA